MKITRVLSAAVLAGTVLVSATGCFHKDEASHTTPSAEVSATATATSPDGVTPLPSGESTVIEVPVAEDTDSASPQVETEAPVAEAGEEEPVAEEKKTFPNVEKEVPAIMSVVNGFYDFAEREDSLDRLMDAGQTIQKQGAITDAEAKAMVAAVPEAFKYFDTSTPENVRNAYNELTATAMGVKTGGSGVTFNVSAEAVNYAGDTASVDKNDVEVSFDGEVQPAIPGGDSNNLNLVKKNGGWLIVASPNGR